MPRDSDSRERMLRAARRLFRRQGYAATGWRQVVATGEAPWGSQSHHFPGGKEQLAVEALDHAGASYRRLISELFAALPPDQAVAAWAEAAADQLETSGWADGCPVATVALEMAHDHDPIAAAAHGAFAGWTTEIKAALEGAGLGAAEAEELAVAVLAGLEGAMLLTRAGRDAATLRTVGTHLARVVAERLAAA